MLRPVIVLMFIFSSSLAWSYQKLECASADGVTYLSDGKMGGAAPYPGQILNLTEIKKNGEVLYRKVFRQDCYGEDFCHLDRPDLNDINADQERLSFIQETKRMLSSEGSEMGPVYKETYTIKASMEQEFWMICQSFKALYP